MGDRLITAAQKEHPAVRIVRYDDDASTNAALTTGQQDYSVVAPGALIAVNDANPVRKMEAKFVMTSFPYAIGMPKDEPALKARMYEWVTKNLDSGKLNEIYMSYFNTPLPEGLGE